MYVEGSASADGGIRDVDSRLVAARVLELWRYPETPEASGRLSSERYGDDVQVLAESSVRHHDAAPLHLLTTASMRWLQAALPLSLIDRRRFRPNILLNVPGSDLVEDGWLGARFRLGTTVIRILDRSERCVMATNAQDDLPNDPAILRGVAKLNESCFGVYAAVETPGHVRVGALLRPL